LSSNISTPIRSFQSDLFVKWPGPLAKLKVEWSYTATPYACMACLFIAHFVYILSELLLNKEEISHFLLNIRQQGFTMAQLVEELQYKPED
jgi:hypothetical protein